MRRIIFAVIIIVLLSSCSYGTELPDRVLEWHSVSEHVVPLIAEANNEDLGRYVVKSYERKSPKGELQVILTEGKGTGSLYVPERVNEADGLFSSMSGYRVLYVSGHRALLEVNENLPLSIAINAGDNITLTIETNSLNESEIVSFGEAVLLSWKDTK